MRIPAYNMFVRHSVIGPTVIISGSVAHGLTLTATGSGYSSLQWYAGSSAIPGVTGSSYTVNRYFGGFANGIKCIGSSSTGLGTSNTLVWLPTTPTTGTLVGDFLPTAIPTASALVPIWFNAVSGGTNLTQSIVATQPTHVVGGGPNGRDAIDFTAASFARSLVANFGLGTNITVGIVTQMPSFTPSSRLIYDGNVSPDTRALYNNGAMSLALYSGGAGCIIASPPSGAWMADTAVFAGASSAHTVNSTTVLGSVGAGTSTGLTIGARVGSISTQGLDAKLARVLVYSGALSNSDRLDVDAYLVEWADLDIGIDLSTGGTFTRSTEGSYLSGSATDGSTPFLFWSAANTRRFENGKFLMEGSRTNIVQDNRNPSTGNWTAGGVATVTGSVTGPDGLLSGSRSNLPAGTYANYINKAVTSGSTYSLSAYVRATAGTSPWQSYILPPDATMTGTLPTTWQRRSVANTANASSMGFIPVDSRNWVAAGGITATAQDVCHDLLQVELGTFPTSQIRTGASTVTRGADILSFAVGAFPEALLAGGTFSFTPLYSSSEFVASGHLYAMLLQLDPNNALAIAAVGGLCRIRLAQGGTNHIDQAFTFSRGQELTFTYSLRNSVSTLTVSGATTGNGTFTGASTGIWPTGLALNIGHQGGGYNAYGHFSRYIMAL